ncbi:hypothetical protein KUTeg_024621 [Tegillarca granosa]|uniref:DDE-1 domain-containing protein n=1 Tax=Tegillarca granosa TaxID=220873 RepID=A0ABQ9E3L5_TEGGR|nr:hypothetical protein KUTeg_024621 [Tegillarca granosa]
MDCLGQSIGHLKLDDFFKNHFLHYVTVKPCILLYDGHSTHVTVEVIEAARNENFLKYLHAHPYSVILKEELPHFIVTAYKSFMTVTNIMSGFRKTGIFPFCSSEPSVSQPQFAKRQEEKCTSRKESIENRNVKILLKQKSEEFNRLKEQNTNKKKKRKTFVPLYGAAVTEDIFYQEKRNRKLNRKKKNEAKKKKNLRSFLLPLS